LVASIVLSLDRQFVSLLFDTNTYAVYAFAYNLLSLITIIISTISVVLYPMLKNSNVESMIKQYSSSVTKMNIFVLFCMVGFSPLYGFIKWILPTYSGSLPILMIVFPGVALSSTITVIIQNYYKILNLTFLYFKKMIIVLIIAMVSIIIAYILFKSPAAISAASVLTFIIWYFIAENYFVKQFNVRVWKNRIYITVMMSSFYATSFVLPNWISSLVYLIIYLIITLAFFREEVKQMFCSVKK